jgi:tRNA pseudouridine38-40 synthase
MLVEYDGARFVGSQFQPGLPTVQGELELAFSKLTGECQRIALAGRTDAGVHAEGQVAAVTTRSDIPARTLVRAMNHHLPEDIVVRAAAEVAPAFDPRRSAAARTYEYRIEDGSQRPALQRGRVWHRRRRLDHEAMAEAASRLPRTPHDWAPFAGSVATGYPTVRSLRRCEVTRCGPRQLRVLMEADGFLPHQVRRTVGALERVGIGRLSAEAFAALADGPPGSAGPTAPARGLTLCSVHYPPGTVVWDDEK